MINYCNLTTLPKHKVQIPWYQSLHIDVLHTIFLFSKWSVVVEAEVMSLPTTFRIGNLLRTKCIDQEFVAGININMRMLWIVYAHNPTLLSWEYDGHVYTLTKNVHLFCTWKRGSKKRTEIKKFASDTKRSFLSWW